jgi:hypothetical protein
VKTDAAVAEVLALTGQFLYRELVTPLGRALDLERTRVAPPQKTVSRATCQGFGLYRVSWPRAALVNRVGRALCQRVVHRWVSKDSSGVKEAVAAWVADLWAKQDLGAESLIALLQSACEKEIKRTPESAFEAAVEAFGPGSEHKPGFLAGLADALKEIEKLVGRPQEILGAAPPILAEALERASARISTEWGQRLAETAVRLMELPEYRLAGAEEALRQVVAGIEHVLQNYESLNREMAGRSAEAYARLHMLLTSPQAAAAGKRKETVMASLPELVRTYGKWRYQSLVLNRVQGTFISLRGHLSDQLREINYCRARINDLARSFEALPPVTAGEGQAGHGRQYFPSGCGTLQEAADQLLAVVTPDRLQDLDRRIQDLLQRQFTALVHVCLASSNVIRNLEQAMLHEAEAFVATQLVNADVAEMYLYHHPEDGTASEALVKDFDEAVPRVVVRGSGYGQEVRMISLPSSAAGQRLRELARQALPDTDLTVCDSDDDLVIYRELPSIPLATLEQVGPLAADVYQQISSVEDFSPHTRIDITHWRTAAG